MKELPGSPTVRAAATALAALACACAPRAPTMADRILGSDLRLLPKESVGLAVVEMQALRDREAAERWLDDLVSGIGDFPSLAIVRQAVGEEALLEVEPHALDRVELGRVGRQRLQRDVVGYAQIARAVPAGAIEHHDHVVVFADGGGEAVEELLHRLGVGVRHDEGEAVVGAGLDGREDVGEGEALVAQPRRALTAPPPDVDRAPLLADARLVLEEQANALVLMRVLSFFEQRRGSF